MEQQINFNILYHKKITFSKKYNSFKISRKFSPIVFLALNLLFVFALKLNLTATILLFSFLSIATTILLILVTSNALSKLERLVYEITLFKTKILMTIIDKSVVIVDFENLHPIVQNVTINDEDYASIIVNVKNRAYYILIDCFEPNLKLEIFNKVVSK